MFTNFSNRFYPEIEVSVQDDIGLYEDLPGELYKLIDTFSGMSFDDGLYRIHSFTSSSQWALIISNYFPKYLNDIYPFGFDWAGRQYCLSKSNSSLLYMFDPSTGEDFSLNQSIVAFHNDDLVNDTIPILSPDIYRKILSFLCLDSIGWCDCLGYKRPLFLGGNDTIENYEKSNLKLYWDLTLQEYLLQGGFTR